MNQQFTCACLIIRSHVIQPTTQKSIEICHLYGWISLNNLSQGDKKKKNNNKKNKYTIWYTESLYIKVLLFSNGFLSLVVICLIVL